jgi:hypothetical protein
VFRSVIDQPRYLLTFIFVCVVASSHLGMLWLSYLYSQVGRLARTMSPEFLAGIPLLIVIFLMITYRLKIPKLPYPLIFLLCFSWVASIGELLRADNFQNLSSFISLLSVFLYAWIGFFSAKLSVNNLKLIPCSKVLFLIYCLWYLGLLFFYSTGELGFYDILPGTEKLRLAFRSGFTSTEIPIYIGFHLPVILYEWFLKRSISEQILTSILVFSAVILAYLSASAAVITAILLVFLIFYFSLKKIQIYGILSFIVVIFFVSISISSFVFTLADTSIAKLMAIGEGDGERGRVYNALVEIIIHQPLGIGLHKFALQNNLSWNGQGIYPHHNFLGIGAELGLPALIFYVLFVLSSCYFLGKGAFPGKGNKRSVEMRLAIAIGLSVLVFQQFRGFFHDTWNFKELYFWVGLSLGFANFSVKRIPIKLNSKRF